MKEENNKMSSKKNFRKALMHLINCYSKENGSNTPDFILATYLVNCLEVFDQAVKRRNEWYCQPGKERSNERKSL